MPFPHYRQLDAKDCGPTCLRMVAKHYGKNYSLQTLRVKSYITEGIRCNRSILINLDTIAAFSSIEHHVELKSGKKLKFAKKVKEQLRTKILDNICCK